MAEQRCDAFESMSAWDFPVLMGSNTPPIASHSPGRDRLRFSVAQAALGKMADLEQTFSHSSSLDFPGCREVVALPHIDLDETTSLIYNRGTGQWTYISKAPPIKNLVVGGGGAKGVFVPGVIQFLEEQGLIEQIEHLAGSSVGSINTALMAAGMSSEEIKKANREQDFKKLLGEGIIKKDGRPLEEFIRRQLRKSACAHLCRIFEVDRLEDITTAEIGRKGVEVPSLQEVVTKLREEEGLTFRMLDTLRRLDPIHFKGLTVTAVCVDLDAPFYFDAESTPDLDIALACRASASLPIVLEEVAIEKKYLAPGYAMPGAGGVYKFIDGGYYDNVPFERMEEKQGKEAVRGEGGQNLQTLVILFDDVRKSEKEQSPFLNHRGGKRNVLYNASNWLTRLIRDLFVRWVVGIKDSVKRHTLTKEGTLNSLSDRYAQRTLLLPVRLEGVGTFDFNEAKRREEECYQRGYRYAEEYWDLHGNGELIARTFDSWEALMTSLPQEEAERIRERLPGGEWRGSPTGPVHFYGQNFGQASGPR